MFKIPKDPESFYPFVFNDTVGLNINGEVMEERLKQALKGHIRDGYQFNAKSALPEREKFYNKSPEPNDKVHVLVCVIPADNLSIMDVRFVEKIRSIRQEASALMIPQFILLTKIDEAHSEVKKDVKNVYKLPSVKDQMTKLSVNVGIPMNCIFPVKNYHEEINIDEDMNALILSALRNMIDSGDDFIKFTRSQPKSS